MFAAAQLAIYAARMVGRSKPLTPQELRSLLRLFCEKYGIRRMDVFGSIARGHASPASDVDLLVTLAEPVPTGVLLEMAGEAEEVIGAPVDFVLKSSLERSGNRLAREHILATAVNVYGG